MTQKDFDRAKQFIPGGVNSPVRSFLSVGGAPIFVERAEGAIIYDREYQGYIDYVCSWGAIILGHAYPKVVSEVKKACEKGMSFGAPTDIETEMAEKICSIANIDKVRMVNSGTEACMSAIRLARGYTGRQLIVKFEGCYHGHADSLLVKAGSGSLTLGVPDSLGIPKELASQTIVLPYNDEKALLNLFEEKGFEIAAVIIEPVAGNMNCIPANESFLKLLRRLCTECDAVLIMDEVMSGFRVALGGAQEIYGVKGDLLCYGKIIGAGLPVGAFGGDAKIMDLLVPTGKVYQAGTLSGNPVALAAGLSVLNTISQDNFHNFLNKKLDRLIEGILLSSQKHQIPLLIQKVGAMWGMFFTRENKVSSLSDVMGCDIQRFKLFFHEMLNEKIYLAPSAFEASFITYEHNDNIIDKTIDAVDKAFINIKK